MRSVLSLAVVSLLAPQSGSPTVKVTFDQEADFSRFKTYDWVPAQEPAPNPVNHIRMTRAVERELEIKGLTKSMENPDLRVTYFAKVEKKLKGTGYQEEIDVVGELRPAHGRGLQARAGRHGHHRAARRRHEADAVAGSGDGEGPAAGRGRPGDRLDGQENPGRVPASRQNH